MDQIVAIKVLKNEHIASEEHVKRFAREAKAASKLRHPNTIRIFDFGSHTDHALYLAMEFLEGDTLAARLDRDSLLSAEQVGHIISQVCHSLTEAHEHGIIHRDLKPENIMLLSVPGVDDFVKVLDFGIAATLAESGDNDEKLTEMGMIMGTPTYMSPEQALGKPLDARSDIYALGVLMYEALTGKVPFEGDQPMNVLVRHINDPPVEPNKCNPDANIPAALERLVLRCLEKDPRHRPQTTAELAGEIERALQNPEGVLRRGAAEVGAQDAVATTAVPGLHDEPVHPVTSAVSAPTRHPSTDHAAAYEGESSKGRGLWLGLGALAIVAVVAGVVAIAVPPAESPTNPPVETPQPAAARVVEDADAAAAPAPTVDAGSAAAEPDTAAVAESADTAAPPATDVAAAAAAAPDAAAAVVDKGTEPSAPKAADAGSRRPERNHSAGRAGPRHADAHAKTAGTEGTTGAKVEPAVEPKPEPKVAPKAEPKPTSKNPGSRDDFRLPE
jgi:serine/threonine-protein kinase